MERFFSKTNAFNVVFFTAIFVMVIIKSILNPQELAIISPILALLIFVLSLLNLIVSITESLITSQTEEMKSLECYFRKDFDNISDLNLFDFQLADKLTLQRVLKKAQTMNFPSHTISDIAQYWFTAKSRFQYRKMRRKFLWAYYFFILLILIYLFIASDLQLFLLDFKVGDYTLWSFVIILFEITIKAALTKDLQRHFEKKTMERIDHLYKELNVQNECLDNKQNYIPESNDQS